MYHGHFFLKPKDAILSCNLPSIYGTDAVFCNSMCMCHKNYLDFPKLIPHLILIDTLPPDDEIVGSLSVVGLLLGGK